MGSVICVVYNEQPAIHNTQNDGAVLCYPITVWSSTTPPFVCVVQTGLLHVGCCTDSLTQPLPNPVFTLARQARGYAGKYCSKPEAWYFLETEKNGLKDWLKCRTVGLCMAYNRLLNFHIVRSTRPVQWTPAMFVPSNDSRALRDPSHVQKCPEYPDPKYYLNHTQKYFFRNAELRHLRVEQFNRYFAMAGDKDAAPMTLEDTMDDEDDDIMPDETHRHSDPAMERVPPGTMFKSTCKNVPGCRRRKSARLGSVGSRSLNPSAPAGSSFTRPSSFWP